jgi:hypothetical protein
MRWTWDLDDRKGRNLIVIKKPPEKQWNIRQDALKYILNDVRIYELELNDQILCVLSLAMFNTWVPLKRDLLYVPSYKLTNIHDDMNNSIIVYLKNVEFISMRRWIRRIIAIYTTWARCKPSRREIYLGTPCRWVEARTRFYDAKGSCEADNNSYCIWYSVGPPLCRFAIEWPVAIYGQTEVTSSKVHISVLKCGSHKELFKMYLTFCSWGLYPAQQLNIWDSDFIVSRIHSFHRKHFDWSTTRPGKSLRTNMKTILPNTNAK